MGVEMQNYPFTRVFVKRASTGLLLFQLIYVSPPFPYAIPLSPIILPYVSFVSIIHFACVSLFLFYLCVCH